jgi:hypothetical protein
MTQEVKLSKHIVYRHAESNRTGNKEKPTEAIKRNVKGIHRAMDKTRLRIFAVGFHLFATGLGEPEADASVGFPVS